MREKITLAILGTGNLAEIIAENLKKPEYDAFRLKAVWGRSLSKAKRLAEGTEAIASDDIGTILEQKPDFVLEATVPDCLKALAPSILKNGSSMIVLSSGALAEEGFKEQVTQAAREGGSRLYVASGAIGGFDFLTTAMLMGGLSLTVRNVKPPSSYQNAPSEAQTLFDGSAAEAIRRFPKNVNVAVAAAEATVGAGKTRVTVESDPNLTLNTHILELCGNFGRASFTMASSPSEKNPGSSEMAAYSVLNLLKRMTQVIVF